MLALHGHAQDDGCRIEFGPCISAIVVPPLTVPE